MSTATLPNTATQTKVVQARNVSKVFKRDAFEVKALDDVSIEIAGASFSPSWALPARAKLPCST